MSNHPDIILDKIAHDDLKNREHANRLAIVEKLRAQGATLRECCVLLSKSEGRTVTPTALYYWLERHAPHLLGSVRSKRPLPSL